MAGKRCFVFISITLFSIIMLVNFISASDISVWQGQYYKGTEFQTGTYEFNFSVYDAKIEGNICFSNATNLTTGNFGEWKTEQFGIGSSCNGVSKDYFLEISINGEKQLPRRRVDLTLLRDSRLINKIISNNFQIDSPTMITYTNRSGFVRNILKNFDSSPNTTIINSLENDAGYTFSMVLSSSTYNMTGASRSNLGALSLNSPGPMWFSIRYYQPFVWKNNPANDGSLMTNQTDVMRLEPEGNLILPLGGINATGNISTIQTGFFSFLGSLTNRITKLFVKDIDASGSIIVTENITIGNQILTDKGCLIPHANFWAERAGSITSGGAPAGLQYSFGDGNTDGGPAQPCSGKIVYLNVHAQTANNGNGKIDLVINNGLSSSCNVTTPQTSGGFSMANCSLSFNAGDTLTPRTTITPSGTNNGYVVSWWVVYD